MFQKKKITFTCDKLHILSLQEIKKNTFLTVIRKTEMPKIGKI